MCRKVQSHIVSIYVKEIKNWKTEEHVRFSSVFKIVDCLTGWEMNFKYTVFYFLVSLFLDPVSSMHRMIQKDHSEPDVKYPFLLKH